MCSVTMVTADILGGLLCVPGAVLSAVLELTVYNLVAKFKSVYFQYTISELGIE